MTAPNTTGRVGQTRSQPGLLELGAPRGPLFPAPVTPTIPATATPLIAHIYNNALTTFKTTLTVLNRPKMKWTLNGGYDSITLNTQIDNAGNLYGLPVYGGPLYGGVALGDICRLTEQSGDGSIIYSGIVESVIDTYDNPANFGLVLTPLVSELGDTGFSTNYVTPTDIAQMVRDAVSSTIHLKFNNYTIPDTGQTAVYDFATTNCLDVLNIARLIAGTNYWWFVDAAGYVWFQPMGFAPEHTMSQMQQFSSLTRTPDITKQKNSFTVIGGIPSGSTTAITATYTGSSTATVGKRTIMPPPTFPTVTSQTVLNTLAATIGGVLDRTINRVDMTALNYTTPIVPNRPGGPMLRYWEPLRYPTQQAATGSGNYSPTFIALENERDGPVQKLKLGDIPVNNVDDLKYMLDNIVRYWTVNASSVNPGVVQPSAGGVITTAGGASTIADSTGLISTGILKLVGASPVIVGSGSATSVTGTIVVGDGSNSASISFTAARTLRLLVLFQVIANQSGGSFGNVVVYVDSQPTSGLAVWDSASTGYTGQTGFWVAEVSAGNHAIDIRATSSAGTLSWSTATYLVAQLGT